LTWVSWPDALCHPTNSLKAVEEFTALSQIRENLPTTLLFVRYHWTADRRGVIAFIVDLK